MESERALLILGEIREEIGGLRADVRNSDRRFEELHRILADRKADDTELSKRINKLEHAHTRLMTIAGLVSAAVSAAFAIVLTLLKGPPWAS